MHPQASRYTSVANQLLDQIKGHYQNDFIFEEANRQKDGAVICALNDGYNDDGVFSASSQEVASTINIYNQAFHSEYPINSADDNNKIPGILYGRYPGDTYAGGTATLALLLTRFSRLLGHLPARPRRVLCSTSRPWSSGADWCLQPDVVSELGLQVTRGCSPRAASPSCTATSTSFWTIFRAFFCSAPPHTRCEPCSTWCLC